jgi:hypothetical protein
MPIFSALRRLLQEDCEFVASLDYRARPYLKKQTKGFRELVSKNQKTSLKVKTVTKCDSHL